MTHATERGADRFEVLEVVSTLGIDGRPGWYIFKRLEDHPRAMGVVDGPFETYEGAHHEAGAMYERRRAVERATH